jgi:uncharacterized protein
MAPGQIPFFTLKIRLDKPNIQGKYRIMIQRTRDMYLLMDRLESYRIVGLLGARQVGKSTMAREIMSAWPGPSHFFDLENPEDLARLSDPMLALKSLEGLVVLDEIQRRPDLFPILRVLADRKPNPAKFLLLGSASPDLLRQSSETLAGRIVYGEIGGFRLEEVGSEELDRLWLRGGLPESFLSASDASSFEWRRAYTRTFLERDLPQLGIKVDANTMRRFWTMLAHYHGQTWNSSEFARSFGVADTTIRTYLDHLTSALVVRQLHPWFENISKRQVKAPKVYISDSGILHTLLNLPEKMDLEGHPKLGSSWEGYLVDQVVRQLNAEPEETFFWGTHAGAELDLLIVRGRKKMGFEFKRTSSPKVTASMRSAMSSLGLTSLDVVHAGEETFPLETGIRALSATDVTTLRMD